MYELWDERTRTSMSAVPTSLAEKIWDMEIAIDRSGLIFHSPTNLGCTRDMTETTIAAAYGDACTATACSICFQGWLVGTSIDEYGETIQ
jgi:hypothetical protein